MLLTIGNMKEDNSRVFVWWECVACENFSMRKLQFLASLHVIQDGHCFILSLNLCKYSICPKGVGALGPTKSYTSRMDVGTYNH